MYSNIGGKIKGLAKVIGWLSLIAGLITFIVLISNKHEVYSRYDSDRMVYNTADDGIAIAALVLGIFGFISSWFTYGFGQLVENSDYIYHHLSLIGKENVKEHQASLSAVEAYESKNSPVAPTTTNHAPSADYVPAWKRVQMEQAANEQKDV